MMVWTKEDSYASVILNDTNSPGTFFPVENYKAGGNTTLVFIAIGDLNNDGLPDLLTENGENIFLIF